MSSIIVSGPSATTASRPSSISSWAKRSARWISRLRRSSPGARFVVLKKGLARLERALGQFMLDVHTGEHGYTEVNPPLLVRDDVMFGTAQLPKFEDDQFLATRTVTRTEMLHDALKYATDAEKERLKRGEIELEALVDGMLDRAPSNERLWLIPTAEVPLTNLVRESIVDEAALPMRLTALHAVLPRRGGRGRQGHPRHDPPASVHQGRAGLDHHAGAEQGRARAHAVLRRGGAAPARPALPRGHAVHRRHGLCRRRRPTTSRSGCRGRGCIARFPPARSAASSRRGA